MAIFLTLLYILTAYLTPPVVFGPLGLYHVQVIIAIPTIILSLMKLQERGLLKMSQTWAAVAILFCAVFSFIFNGLTREAPAAFLSFFTSVAAFFFVAANFYKKAHLKLLVAVLFFVTVFVIVQSQIAEKTADFTRGQPKIATYYIFMNSDHGGRFFRIQGLGVIGDPNDFGQFMMALMPCVFFYWDKGKSALNLIRVYVPVAVILTGIYLTHSRGALLALAAVLIFIFRKKIGLIPSAIGGFALLGGLMAAGFTGGRDVSASSGEDRMALWSTGLQLIRSHPIFGVGFEHFRDHAPNTAHNTIVVCAAETGVVGLFFWVAFIVATLYDAFAVSNWGLEEEKAKKQAEADAGRQFDARRPRAAAMPKQVAFAGPKLVSAPIGSPLLDQNVRQSGPPAFVRPVEARRSASETRNAASRPLQPAFLAATAPSEISQQEIRRMAGLILVSFVGLFVTGWFLSRAYSMVFFIYGGIAAVICRMAREAGMEIPRLPLSRTLKLSIAPTIVLVAIVYAILRVNNLFH